MAGLRWSQMVVPPVKTEDVVGALEAAIIDLLTLKVALAEDMEFWHLPSIVSRATDHVDFIKSSMSVMAVSHIANGGDFIRPTEGAQSVDTTGPSGANGAGSPRGPDSGQVEQAPSGLEGSSGAEGCSSTQ